MLLCISACVLADAPRLNKKNRYADGKVTVIILTSEQQKFLDRRNKHWTELPGKDSREKWYSTLLRLTPEQSQQIKRDTGISPSKLQVRDTRDGEVGDCTCQAANVSFRFDKDKVEVLHDFVYSDQKAQKIWDDFANQFK